MKNLIYEPGYNLSVVVTDPAAPNSGDPVRFGNLTGIASVDEGDGGNDSTKTSCNFGPFVADIPVVAEAGAISVGDALFYDDAIHGVNNDSSNGYFYGFALEAIGNGETDTINVYHVPSPGAGTLGAGTVGAANLASNAVTTAKILANNVTAAKLTATLATGFVPLPLTAAREIATNDIAALAAHGGILASDSTPILKRQNGATDKKMYVEWAASNSDEIAWDFVYPPDLDDAAVVTVHLLAKMNGATDTPVIAVSYFEGIGDTNAGGNSAALSGTLAEVTVEIAAADIGAAPTGASVGLVPGAHTTDKVQLLAAWIEYTRK